MTAYSRPIYYSNEARALYAEGYDAAWNEYQKGDKAPTLADIAASAKSVLEVDADGAAAFAMGWMEGATRIENGTY